MIPARIDGDADEHYFLTDERDGHHLVFVSREAIKENPFHPHWVGTCGDQEALHAMVRWTAVRRDQWRDWGALAERVGPEAFAAHMDGLFDADPLVRVEAALIQRQDDPAQLGVGEMTAGPAGLRLEILHVHTFASVEACDAFHDWFNSDGNHRLAADLVRIAFNEGTDELGATLDEIAAERLTTPPRAPRSRRRGGRGRAEAAAI